MLKRLWYNLEYTVMLVLHAYMEQFANANQYLYLQIPFQENYHPGVPKSK